MGVGTWFRGLFGGEKRAGTGFEVSRWTSPPPRRGAAELIAAYKLMPWLKTIVDTTADGVADLNWKVVRPAANTKSKQRLARVRRLEPKFRHGYIKAMIDSGEATEVANAPMLQLIHDPSDNASGRQLQKLEQIYLDLVGEAFMVLDLVGNLPVGYWLLPPSAVRLLPDFMLPVAEQFYTVNFGRVTGRVHVSHMVHIRHMDPEDPMGRGVGTGFTLGDELDTDEYAARFTKNYFFNNTIPGAVMSIEGAPPTFHNDPATKAFKEALTREYGGAQNAGKLMITSGKVTMARLDTDLKNMDLNSLRKAGQNFARVCYRVPAEVVGDSSSSSKVAAWVAGDNFARYCIVPRAEFKRAEYQALLMPRLGQEGDVLDYDSPCPEDQEFQLRVMGTFPSNFTGNEARALAGMKPDPRLSDLMAPLPGQVEAGPKTPDAPQGSEADTAEEQNQPSNQKADPPWALNRL